MKSEHQFKRTDSYSRARYKFRVKSVTRPSMTTAIIPLHDARWRNIYSCLARMPSFSGKSPTIFIVKSSFLHTNFIDFFFFPVYYHATDVVLTAEDTEVPKMNKIPTLMEFTF